MEESPFINREKPVKECLIEIKEMESKPASKGSIHRVPKYIRRINEDTYTPKLISIGPLHYDKKKFADMENKKKIYVKSVLDRIPPGKMDEIITFVQTNEQRIRDSYADTFDPKGCEFVMMIVCDALFIIEHFLRTFDGFRISIDSWLHLPVVRSALSLDLLLLENQLPYFVLEEIYNILAFEEVPFLQISGFFFRCAFDLGFYDLPPEPKHFTDLIRTALVKSCPEVVGQKGPITDLPSARELRHSGIKFKSTEGKGLLDVRFSCFSKVQELCLPQITVYNCTECLLGNVMALEQCYYPSDTSVCNYVKLMSYLMKTNKDVELLVAVGIISNVYGEDAEVANMFHKLGSQIALDENSSYHYMCKELIKSYRSFWNRYRATLWSFVTDPVGGTATFIAFLALVFTLIQTICSLMQFE